MTNIIQLAERINTLMTDLAAAKQEMNVLLAGNSPTSLMTTSTPNGRGSVGTAGAKKAVTASKSSPKKNNGKPISERVRTLLENGPHTFEALYTKIGPDFKAAIRSTVDKGRTKGAYGYDGEQYFIAATKSKKAKKVPAKSTKSAPAQAVAPMIVKAEPVAEMAPVAEPAKSPDLVNLLLVPTPGVVRRRPVNGQ